MSCTKDVWVSIEGKVDAATLSFSFEASTDSGKRVSRVKREIEILAHSIPPLRGDVALVGECSSPVAGVVVSCLRDCFEDVAIVDPELNGYVVVHSTGGRYAVGDVIPEKSVLRPPYVL